MRFCSADLTIASRLLLTAPHCVAGRRQKSQIAADLARSPSRRHGVAMMLASYPQTGSQAVDNRPPPAGSST